MDREDAPARSAGSSQVISFEARKARRKKNRRGSSGQPLAPSGVSSGGGAIAETAIATFPIPGSYPDPSAEPDAEADAQPEPSPLPESTPRAVPSWLWAAVVLGLTAGLLLVYLLLPVRP